MEEVGLRLGVQGRSTFSREMGTARRDVEQFGSTASRAATRTSLATRAMGGLSRAGSFVKRSLTGLWSITKRAAMGLAALGAAAGLAAKKAIGDAADLGESINKTQVVFEKHARSVLKWSRKTGDALGISRAAALEAAGGYGAMFQALDLGQKPAARMSVALVKLAADMGSLHNVDPTEMLDKIRAGMSGEMEPLKKYGIVLSETAVKEFAYAEGIAKRGKELEEVEKIEARYGLLMKQSATAHDDFGNTMDSLPNIMRRLRAEFTNHSAVLGKRLLPAAEDLASWALDLMPRAFAVLRRGVNSTVAHIDRLATVLKDPSMKGKGLADKLRLSWELIIAQPFEAWWSKNGDRFTSRAAKLIGKGMGKVMRGMILAPLFILGGEKKEIEDAGVKIGVRFWRSFVKALNPKDLAERLTSALGGSLSGAAGGDMSALLPWLGMGLFTKSGRGLIGKGLKWGGGKLLGRLGVGMAGRAATGAGAAWYTGMTGASTGVAGAGAAGGLGAGALATGALYAAPLVAGGYAAYKVNQAGTEAQKQANKAIMAGIPLMDAYEKATRKGIHTSADLVTQIKTELQWARDRGASQDEINDLQDAATRILARHNEWLRKTNTETKAMSRALRNAGREWREFNESVGGMGNFSYVPPSIRKASAAASGGPGGVQKRAAGGSIMKGVPYLVGEEGPEIRVFDQGGSIVANKEAFGGGLHVDQINLNFPNVRRVGQIEARELARSVQDAFADEFGRH